MRAAAALSACPRDPFGEQCGVRTGTADIVTAMSDPGRAVEVSMQFSSSSSFSSASPPIEKRESANMRAFVSIEASSERRPTDEGGGLYMTSPRPVGPPPLVHDEGEVLYTTSSLQIHLLRVASSARRDSSHRVSGSARAGVDSGRHSFSTLRDSESPPNISAYFGGAASTARHKVQAEGSSVCLMRGIALFTGVESPRSSLARAAGTVQGSVTTSALPVAMSSHPRETEASQSSLPLEFVVVNADRARAAHEMLTSFSAATIARYRLVKLQVAQRLYRLYYDKWLSKAVVRAPAESLLRLSKDTQTDALRHRSLSGETDFADVDSFHVSRSMSPAVDAIRVDVVADVPLSSAPSFCDSAATPTLFPWRGEGVPGERGISVTFSSAPAFRLQTFARASPSPQSLLCEHCTHTIPTPPATPPRDGIAVRTKPAKLVDFGRHSAAPKRCTLHPASVPVVRLPAVVPSPERIFRL
ncbi:hypothetical protein LSCM1_01618 [Leishmania martiniquensis]|uniref:Uncharacterized protein n=1 Tax=Leishmania martiniquensis TaxID=1580590 RepID=A0A836GTE8_9TRYP|nr:hypothetical protein LSCM1_01618 [Leishmania martiniquensis]